MKEKLNYQVEIDSLRAKLIEEEAALQKLQEQILVEKLKRVTTPHATDEEIRNGNQEMIRGKIILFRKNSSIIDAAEFNDEFHSTFSLVKDSVPDCAR